MSPHEVGENRQRKTHFLKLMEYHFGITVTEEETDHFVNRTTYYDATAADAHIHDRDVDEAHQYLQSESRAGKTQVVFNSADEMLQFDTLNKVQSIAERCAEDNLFDTMYYLTDDFYGTKVYAEYCKTENRPNIMQIIGGTHFSLHQTYQPHLRRAVHKPNKPYKFVYYTRQTRPHRVYITGYFLASGLIDQGLVSCWAGDKEIEQIHQNINDYYNPLEDMPDVLFIDELLALRDNWDKFPIVLDFPDPWNADRPIEGTYEDSIEHAEQSYFTVIGETSFFRPMSNNLVGAMADDLGGAFFTEKTFKPILLDHPFVMLAYQGNLSRLRSYGFKTFGDYWDESYDDIVNDLDRYAAIKKLIAELCAKTNEEWDTMLQDMKDLLEHNRNLLINKPFNTATDFTFAQALKLVKG